MQNMQSNTKRTISLAMSSHVHMCTTCNIVVVVVQMQTMQCKISSRLVRTTAYRTRAGYAHASETRTRRTLERGREASKTRASLNIERRRASAGRAKAAHVQIRVGFA